MTFDVYFWVYFTIAVLALIPVVVGVWFFKFMQKGDDGAAAESAETAAEE